MRAQAFVLTVAALAAPSPAFAQQELVAYGEYLSGECASCHVNATSASAIPVIAGMDAEYFVEAMRDYRDGVRENPAMVAVARSLDAEQTAALAAYFASLPDPFDEEEAEEVETRLADALAEAKAALEEVKAARRALERAQAALEEVLEP